MKKGVRFFNGFSEDGNGKEHSRGRSARLIKERNDKLFHRYYYYVKILHYKYELVLQALANEFDLAEFSIAKLITENIKWVKEIGDKKLTRAQLKSRYPHFNWNDKEAAQQVKQKETVVLK